jgi:DNA-binding GntR family transcriptional regulator
LAAVTLLTPAGAHGSVDLPALLTSFPLDLSSDGGLPQRMAQALSEAIIDGRLQSGARLSETVIADSFGVSRTPVREALYALEHDGLIERPPRKGATVSAVSHQQVVDIYVCRALIYGRSARLAAPLLTETELAELATRAEHMVEVATKGDTKAYFQLHIDFHDAVAKATGNQMLLKLMSDMGSMTLRLRYMSLTIPGQLTRSAKLHRTELVPLLRKADAVGAEKSVQRTISVAGDAVLAHFYGDNSKPVHQLVKEW